MANGFSQFLEYVNSEKRLSKWPGRYHGMQYLRILYNDRITPKITEAGFEWHVKHRFYSAKLDSYDYEYPDWKRFELIPEEGYIGIFTTIGNVYYFSKEEDRVIAILKHGMSE